MAKGREVAAPAGGSIAITSERPEWMSTEKTRGSENVSTEDLVIPRLEIVQALSPALKRSDPKFIEGAQMGDLTNSVTRKNYGKEAYLINVFFSKQWLVWRLKSEGGGFFGAFADETLARMRSNEEGGESAGIEVVDTPQHLCLILDPRDGTVEEIMVPLAKTKAKVSRSWNSMIRLAGGDRFSRVYKVTAVEESNPKGDFWNYNVQQIGFPPELIYKKAEKLYDQIAAGEKKVVMHVDEDDGTPSGEM